MLTGLLDSSRMRLFQYSLFPGAWTAFFIVCVCCTSPLVYAEGQSPNSHQAQPINTGNSLRSAAFTPAGRDPFAVTTAMLSNEGQQLKADIDFVPLQGNLKIPNMRLKGIITGKGNKEMAALLEVDGLGVFVVREGDTVGLHGIGNGRDVIQIESISRLSLIVKSGSYGGSQKRFVVR